LRCRSKRGLGARLVARCRYPSAELKNERHLVIVIMHAVATATPPDDARRVFRPHPGKRAPQLLDSVRVLRWAIPAIRSSARIGRRLDERLSNSVLSAGSRAAMPISTSTASPRRGSRTRWRGQGGIETAARPWPRSTPLRPPGKRGELYTATTPTRPNCGQHSAALAAAATRRLSSKDVRHNRGMSLAGSGLHYEARPM
jgi:hypothetical protein